MSVHIDTDIRLSSVLRRYLDLPKFLDLLHSRSLYLRRADGFPDPFEGALLPAFRKLLDQAFQRGEIDEDADGFYRRARVGSYISCWSLGAKDNMALWQLYGGVRTCVAITTTVGRLVEVVRSWNESASISKINYIDHFRRQDILVSRYVDILKYKNEAYRYENELRLIISRRKAGWESNPIGIRLPAGDLQTLVRSVVIAPEAEPWFYDAIVDLCARYSLNVPVRRSKLAFVPK